MANDFASNFGDVVKHCLLAEAVACERPARYLESHGGRIDYELGTLTPGRGGVWDFIAVAAAHPGLQDARYLQLLHRMAGTPDAPGTYPGSVSVADAQLSPEATVFAFDLVATSGASVREALASRGRPAVVTIGDGIQGVLDHAAAGDLVLLDPFQVTDAGGTGPDSAGAFAALADRGIATLLWYGVFDLDAQLDWPQDVRRSAGTPLWRVEYSCGDDEAGLTGCGVLAANLGPETERVLTRVAEALGEALTAKIPALRVMAAPSDDPGHPLWHPLGARQIAA